MAARYWVGGAATWDATAGTKWSTTSGGAGGAAVPTAADDVFFNAASGSVAISIANGAVCQSFDCTGCTATVTHAAAATMTIGGTSSGGFKLVPGMSWTSGSGAVLTFAGGNGATYLLDLGGQVVRYITQTTNTNTTLSLQSTLQSTGGSLFVLQGKFVTNNNIINTGSLRLNSNGNVRSIDLGSSVVTLSDPGTTTPIPVDCGTGGANLTIIPGTSSIVMSGSGSTTPVQFNGAGKTFYDVSFTAAGAFQIAGSNGYHNLTINAPTGIFNSVNLQTAGSTQTVSNQFSCNGFNQNNRSILQSATAGSTCTISAAVTSLSYCDFADIIGTGAAAWTGTSLADAYNNTGITFTAPVTLYWIGGAATSFFASANWSLTSGGSTAGLAPTVQDTCIFDASSISANSVVINADRPRMCRDLDYSAMTNRTGCSINITTTMDIFGSFKGTAASSNMIISGAFTLRFRGRNSHTLTNLKSGGSIVNPQILAVTGTYTLMSDVQGSILSVGAWIGTLQLSSGTLDLNGWNFAARSFVCTGTLTRALIMGPGSSLATHTTGGTFWNMTATGMTLTMDDTAIIDQQVANIVSNTVGFAGGGLSYGILRYVAPNSPGPMTITGANSFKDVQVYDTTAAKSVVFPAGVITTIRDPKALRNLFGAAGNLGSVASSTPGTKAQIALPNGNGGTSSYLTVTDIQVNTSNWYAGDTSVDGGGNTASVIFANAPAGSGDLLLAMS